MQQHFRRIPDGGDIVTLSEEPVRLITTESEHDGVASVTMRRIPDLRMVVESKVPTPQPDLLRLLFDAEQFQVRFPGRELQLDVFASGGSMGAGITLRSWPRIEPVFLKPTGKVSKIGFHLLNFPSFVTQSDEGLWDNWVEMQVDKVKVVLAPADELASPRIEGPGLNLFKLTHVGWLERSDNKGFSEKQIKEWLASLLYFLSFARGGWTGPFLPFGVNRANEKTWEEWGARPTDSSRFRISWLPHEGGHILSAAFPGFISAFRNPILQPSLQKAIYWYMIANAQAARLDGSVVLTQAALEVLAWSYLVELNQALSPEGFDKLPAADQIRLLLTSLQIPARVQPEQPELLRYAKAFDLDGPSVFTQYRNRIVHPSPRHQKNRKNEDVPAWQVWNLGIWYLELVILRLCNYAGEYRNRLHKRPAAAGPQRVPWSA